MTYKTHLNFGILSCLLVSIYIFNFDSNILTSLLISGIVALIPDIDHHNSKINKICTPIIYIVLLFYLVFYKHLYILISSLLWVIIAIKSKHRTFTHSLIGLLIFILPFINSNYFIPVIIGYISHLLSDMFTKNGIPLLYPIKTMDKKHYLKTNIGFIKTGGKFENIICIMLIILNIYLITSISLYGISRYAF
jgi:inner membrane protein